MFTLIFIQEINYAVVSVVKDRPKARLQENTVIYGKVDHKATAEHSAEPVSEQPPELPPKQKEKKIL